MGEVYRAQDTRLDRTVAIKVLSSTFSADSDRLRRFEQEARSASALNHPNIITIYELGRDGSTHFIAMELVEGKTVRELLTSGLLPIQKAIEIAAQAAEGLTKAHEAGIAHRDLKPDNLMVSDDGFVKILDFGLAKLTLPSGELTEASPTVAWQTRPGVVMGTMQYMSPEQASGGRLDFRSDQFSFGLVLYEMVTGKRAFRRNTTAETLVAILREQTDPIGLQNPDAPAPLCWVIERCLAKDPEQTLRSRPESLHASWRPFATASRRSRPGRSRVARPIYRRSGRGWWDVTRKSPPPRNCCCVRMCAWSRSQARAGSANRDSRCKWRMIWSSSFRAALILFRSPR